MKNSFKLLVSVLGLAGLVFVLVYAVVVPAAERDADSAVAAVQADLDDCQRVTPRAMPRYSIAGLWAGLERDTFVLVDPAERRLALFDRGETSIGSPPAAIASTLDFMQPVGASGLPGGGMVIEAAGGRFWQLDSDMLPVTGVYDIGRDAGIAGFFPFRWEVAGDGLDEGGLIVCGDVKYNATDPRFDENDPWTNGIFYVPTNQGPGAGVREIYRFEDLGDINRLGCRLGGQIFAVVDGEPYVLLLSGIEHGVKRQPQIYRIDIDAPEGERMKPLELVGRPEAMKVTPPLATFWPASQFAALMQDVEASTMPTEMVAWGESLYVALRTPSSEPSSGGMTDYSIARVDPHSGEVVTSPLESKAHHLSLIAGPDRFAVVEKGPAQNLGDQRVNGFQLVATARMESSRPEVAICR